jgi:hypothetical protein
MSCRHDWKLAAGTLAVVFVAGTADAAEISRHALTNATTAAFQHWKVQMKAKGWIGLQSEISDCFAGVAARPSQARAAYCAALDHYTMLDVLNFPEGLRPPFFNSDAVFARLDKAVALTTPPANRADFDRAFLAAASDSLRAKP